MRYLFAALWISLAAPAFACKCGISTRDETIAASDAVFTGSVQSVENQGQLNVATVNVMGVLKGGDLGSQLQLVTPSAGTACGVALTPGQNKEFAARQYNGAWVISACSQNGLK